MGLAISNGFNYPSSMCYLNNTSVYTPPVPVIDYSAYGRLFTGCLQKDPVSLAEVVSDYVRPLISKLPSFPKQLFATIPQLDIDKIEKRIPLESPFVEVRSVAQQLLKLQRSLSDTHYVLSHGMAQIQTIITKFIGDLDHRLWPNRHPNGFLFSRVVPPNKVGKSLKEFLSQSIDDRKLRSDLLSVDADLLHTEFGESALYFYLINQNVFEYVPGIICDTLKNFAHEFNMEFSKEACRSKVDINVYDYNHRESKAGAILVYAIPKTLVNNPDTNFVYTSHPLGIPVDKDNPLSLFEELVEGTNTKKQISVRLLASHLKPENGIKSFLIGAEETTCGRAQTKELLRISEIFFQSVIDHCRAYFSPNDHFSRSPELYAECERLLHELPSQGR